MYTLGIDIGSTSSKTVILEDGIKIAAHVVIPLGTGTIGPETALDEIFRQSGISKDQITYTVATGYGRLTCPEANAQISELSCHAKESIFFFHRWTPSSTLAVRMPKRSLYLRRESLPLSR